jgi:Tol biopolymer transport system component
MKKFIHSAFRAIGAIVVIVIGVGGIIASNGNDEPGVSTIVFHSNEEGRNKIYMVDASGSDQRKITDPSGQIEDTYPAWSRDKKKIAFTRTEGNNSEIYLMNHDGTGVQNLTNNPAADEGPAWSPDGSQLAFSSNRDGNWRIYVLNLEDNSLKALTGANSASNRPSWSPDGLKIVYQRDTDEESDDIYVMNSSDGSDKINLTGDTEWPGMFPAWSPIESPSVPSQIAYLNIGIHGSQIWLMKPDGSGKKQLTFPVGAIGQVLSRAAWSALGDSLVYVSDRDAATSPDLYRIVVKDGSDITRITASYASEGGPDW